VINSITELSHPWKCDKVLLQVSHIYQETKIGFYKGHNCISRVVKYTSIQTPSYLKIISSFNIEEISAATNEMS
jgi:hypothetical protein